MVRGPGDWPQASPIAPIRSEHGERDVIQYAAARAGALAGVCVGETQSGR